MKNTAPQSIAELEQRLRSIAGLKLGDLAKPLGITVPENLLQKKGFVGQLVELVLGADGGNLAQPDFSELGVELKTVPVDQSGKPQESTYISVVPLMDRTLQDWEHSVVKAKLSKVLWLPVEASREISLHERRLGSGFIWQPDEQLMSELKADYQELVTKIICGEVESITSDLGQWIQIRPKAANSKVLTDAIGPEGQVIKTLPRGFYLRPSLTRKILARQFT